MIYECKVYTRFWTVGMKTGCKVFSWKFFILSVFWNDNFDISDEI
jgi:hypothetical protein